MNLLLTSSFPQKDNTLIVDYLKKQSDNLKILYIGYTSNAEKYSRKVIDYGFSYVDFLNITKGFKSEELVEYDVFSLHGGNPYSIKSKIIKSNFDDFLRSTKGMIITTSGSTLVVSKSYDIIRILYPKMKMIDTKGLNLFPFNVIPHYQRYKKQENDIINYMKEKTLYTIPDGSAIAYNGENIELIGNVGVKTINKTKEV
ncbi:MAG: Type 1 glutamine amidotransferase-like domain-containing protein [Candidatus Odinarchaeota archaeon]